MNKILLPTDFSDNSWNAIKYALQLYKNEECVFTILNTYTPVVYQLEYMQVSTMEFDLLDTSKQVSNKGLENMKQRIETEFNNPKHTFTFIASFNTLVTEIEEQCKANKIDTIVIGTKGATGAVDVLLGTNTVHVIKNTKYPILAIPSGFSFETPHEILFPSDYQVSFKDKHVLPLVNMASIYTSRVNILHVNYGETLSEKQQENKQKLAVYFEHIAHLFHDIKNNNVDDAINEFQLKTKVNLLVMINNKHSFFENLFFKSTINKIGIHLKIPFLIIPSKL